jgi:alpha-galactosidase
MAQELERPHLSRREVLKGGFVIALGGLGPVLPRGQAALASDRQERRWTIGNGLIQRVVAFSPKGGLVTEQLSGLSAQREFVLSGHLRMDMAQEFSFACEGHDYAGNTSAVELLGAEETGIHGGKRLVVRLRLRDLSLEVDVVYRVYEGHPVVRKYLLLRNTGASKLRFTRLTIEALGISLGPENETVLDANYGTVPREIFYTGRSEDAGLLVANARSQDGIAVLNEVPGYMKRTEIGGWDDPEQVRLSVLYDTDLMPFERTLAPGEEFVTACASLAVFRRGAGFQDPQWVLPSYGANVLMRRVNAQGPPWIYNTWEPFERGINREIALELIEAAGEMGIDVFTIDDGWQQEYGENTVNLASFPGGLEPILEAVEAKGMRLGLWMPLAAIGTSTAEYRAHPELACRDLQGDTKLTVTMGGSKAVMCLASSYRDAAAERINDAISRFRLAYVKLDITTIFNAYGEAPGCWAQGHNHRNWAESLNMIYEGIAYVTGKIYEKHPEVLLDLTFEVWGQKHIIDGGLLAAGDLDWMSNVDDTKPDSAGPRQARQLLYQRAASMPVESMLIGNMHAELPSIEESFATAIGSAPLLLGDLRKLSAADRQWYHEKILWFKGLRKKTEISESFFPLGSWRQPMSTRWDGFARMARSGDGVIALFRNQSEEAKALVQLPLLPPGRYRVGSVLAGKELGVFSHSDWTRGIEVVFPGTNRVEVLEVKAVERG